MSDTNEYLSNITAAQKAEYDRIREIVLQNVPDVEETFSYGMPTFKYNGKPLLYFGAFKNHMSLFPASGSVVESLGDKLSQFHTSKGTLQFTHENPIPDDTVKEMVLRRLEDISK